MASGWAKLGAVLGGGAQVVGQRAYDNELKTRAGVEALMQEAALRRAQAIRQVSQNDARSRYLTDYQNAGLGDLAQFAADAGLGASSSNPNQIIATLPQVRAYQAANLGDDATMNRMDSARTGTPLKLSDSSGGITTANPYTNPEVAPNALGDAAILAHRAAANASNASAARARAGIGVDKAGNYSIETDAHGNMVRVNKLTGEVSPLKLGDAALQAKGANRASKLPSAKDISGALGMAFPDARGTNGGIDPGLSQDVMQRLANGETLTHIIANPPIQTTKPDGATGWYDATLDAGGGRPVPTPPNGPAALGDAVAAPAPNARIVLAPGTNPGVAAAVRAAAGANAAVDATHAGPELAPYQDGTKLRGKDGKMYVVQHGLPVPVQ